MKWLNKLIELLKKWFKKEDKGEVSSPKPVEPVKPKEPDGFGPAEPILPPPQPVKPSGPVHEDWEKLGYKEPSIIRFLGHDPAYPPPAKFYEDHNLPHKITNPNTYFGERDAFPYIFEVERNRTIALTFIVKEGTKKLEITGDARRVDLGDTVSEASVDGLIPSQVVDAAMMRITAVNPPPGHYVFRFRPGFTGKMRTQIYR